MHKNNYRQKQSTTNNSQPQESTTVNQETAVLAATIPMTLMDALPVLGFCVAMALVADLYPSVLFLIGTIFCVLAGVGKVLYKLLLATVKKEVGLFYFQFRITMPAGALCMVLSLFIDQPDLPLLWQNISSYPCNIFFGLALLCAIILTILAFTLDAKSAKANWLEQTFNLLMQVFILLPILIIWYAADYYASDLTEYEMDRMTTSITVVDLAYGTFFDGPGEDAIYIFYPGAKVESASYEPLMQKIAESGIDCYLVDMSYHLAIFGMNRADAIIEELTEIYGDDATGSSAIDAATANAATTDTDVIAAAAGSNQHTYYYIGGHSLGGAMAAVYAASHQDDLSGLILLASYATKSLGDLPVLSIYGSEDGVLHFQKAEETATYTSNYTGVILQGGNHAQFGAYGPQAGDGIASITRDEQLAQTVAAIAEFVE